MSHRYLLDTNVLVYLHDPSDPARHERARKVVAEVGRRPSAALPVQALAELASVALRKLRLDARLVHRHVESLERAFTILPLTPAVVLESIRGVRDHQLSYYDAQIWASAKLAQIPIVLTEDFSVGAVLEGVTFLDPFAASFDVTTL